jgi:hypothetical protein
MNKLLFVLLSVFAFTSVSVSDKCGLVEPVIDPKNNCINFSVGPGTGCDWMCNYCANQLGTNNYYFTTGVCTYQTGGCVGNPQSGVTYTCCSA